MHHHAVRVGIAALAGAAILAVAPAHASSHREAPGITKMPKVDGSDFYMFNSYEAGRTGYVTFLANYAPLQDAYGGPNFFTLDPDATYNIHVDNAGNGVESLTFQFRVRQEFKNITLPVGGQTVSVPFFNVGQITSGPGGDAAQNVEESYTLQVLGGPLASPTSRGYATDASSGSTRFGKPVDNIGNKSVPNYHDYAASFIHTINIPGCSATGRVFVGQRHDGFAVNLGEIFDLVNIANPLGARDAEPNTLADKNVTTFALEVPASCLVSKGGTVVGAWTTAWLPQDRTLSTTPDFRDANQSGPLVQVSRLGAPLVNEVVIGLADKNKFNASQPSGDTQFAAYVTNPTLPAVLQLLFGAAGVQAPTNFPRKDLIAAFLTGVGGLNQLGGPAEELRLNTSIAPVAPAQQNNLGVLGGDNAGFPNGRRPGDDVVDIELRVSMGVLCVAFPGVYCNPSDAPSGALPFTDGTLNDVSQFDTTFPYLQDPFPGSPNGPLGPNGNGLTNSQ
jgi:hypothetical protein